jgi:hypothetical protein
MHIVVYFVRVLVIEISRKKKKEKIRHKVRARATSQFPFNSTKKNKQTNKNSFKKKRISKRRYYSLPQVNSNRGTCMEVSVSLRSSFSSSFLRLFAVAR